jgi:D-beta-D-heptose 7-phosphate kinase/D-beta-D-heptose 1-phosphate adenosyltransferase
MNNLYKIKNKLNSKSCIVIGDIMLDKYIYGKVRRISPEAPIPVLSVTDRIDILGGASNVATNVISSKVDTSLCGVLGKDKNGIDIKKMLCDKNINYRGIIVEDRETICKTRVIGADQQIVRIDDESVLPISKEEADRLLESIEDKTGKSCLIIISDYAKGVCTPYLCKKVVEMAKNSDCKVIVDPKGSDWEKYSGAYIITPNWKEFVQVVGEINPDDDIAIEAKARELISKLQLKNLLITRSERGMVLITKNEYVPIPTQAREVADVSGAGDTVVAMLATMLLAGEKIEDAVIWANKAAGLAVERLGTSVVGIDDLIEDEKNIFESNHINFKNKIMSIEELMIHLPVLKKNGGKVVFTNGCFDLLHEGHLQYLSEARQLGDYLIVGLNSDLSVRHQGKGENRPINRQDSRATMLAALEFVDAVIIFDEDTPYELLKHIRPDILVKGGDYSVEEIIGREFAGETKVLPFKFGFSTTGLIGRIRGCC